MLFAMKRKIVPIRLTSRSSIIKRNLLVDRDIMFLSAVIYLFKLHHSVVASSNPWAEPIIALLNARYFTTNVKSFDRAA
ncbi:unnamed protein product [Boreogadus saida]